MGFRTSWTAEVLAGTPMIAPARSYVWPMRIAGEEEALARGAVNVMVRPRTGGNYLVTAALGFKDPSVPTGVFGCANEDEICVVAGGYAYLAKADEPEAVTLLAMKPVVEVREAAEAGLLLFVGFHTVLAWGSEGPAWETGTAVVGGGSGDGGDGRGGGRLRVGPDARCGGGVPGGSADGCPRGWRVEEQELKWLLGRWRVGRLLRVERDGAISLLVDAGAGEETVAGGGLEAAAGVLGEDEGSRGEQG